MQTGSPDEIVFGQGWIDVDANQRTSVEGIFAGGDVQDISLVTTAVGQGRVAAEAIDKGLAKALLECWVAATNGAAA